MHCTPPVFACLPPSQCLVSFLADVFSCLTREPSLWTMWLPQPSWAMGWSCCACRGSSSTPYAWSWPSPQQRGKTSNRYWSPSWAGGFSMADPCQKQWQHPSFIPLTIISWLVFFLLAFVSLVHGRFIFPSFTAQIAGRDLFQSEMVKNQNPSSEFQVSMSS